MKRQIASLNLLRLYCAILLIILSFLVVPSAKAQSLDLPNYASVSGTEITNTHGAWVRIDPAQPNNIDLVETRIFKMPKKNQGISGIEFKLVGGDGGTSHFKDLFNDSFANGGRGGEVIFTLRMDRPTSWFAVPGGLDRLWERPFIVTFGKKGESTSHNAQLRSSGGGGGGSTGMAFIEPGINSGYLNRKVLLGRFIAAAGGGSGGFALVNQSINGNSATGNASGNTSVQDMPDELYAPVYTTTVNGTGRQTIFYSGGSILRTRLDVLNGPVSNERLKTTGSIRNVFNYSINVNQGPTILTGITHGQEGGKPLTQIIYSGVPVQVNPFSGNLTDAYVTKQGGRGGAGLAGGGAGSSVTSNYTGDPAGFGFPTFPTGGAGGSGTPTYWNAFPNPYPQTAMAGHNDYKMSNGDMAGPLNVTVSPRSSTATPESGYIMYRTIPDTEPPQVWWTFGDKTVTLHDYKGFGYSPNVSLEEFIAPYLNQWTGLYDNDGIASVTATSAGPLTEFTCADAGKTIPVNLTITDFAGNVTNHFLWVTVVDPFKPRTRFQFEPSPNPWDAFAHLRISVTSGPVTLTAANFPEPYDGCKGKSGVTTHFPPTTFTCADVGNKTIEFFYTDSDGNNSPVYAKTFMVEYAETPRLYVDATATGTNDGSSWVNAFTNLQDAINYGCVNSGSGREIYVAKGTYYPDKGNGITPGNRNATFLLSDRVKLYGGFPNGGGDFASRNPETNATILSGAIGGGIDTDNSLHVVTITGNNTIVEGFTIRNGYANDNQTIGGGGLILKQSQGTVNGNHNTTIRNCKFLNNYGTEGGAIYTDHRNEYFFNYLNIQNCLFERNTATRNGGAVRLNNQTAWTNMRQNFVNCIFNNNTANANGGALYAVPNAEVNVTNSTFSANNAGIAGGAVYNQGTVKLHNSILFFDTAIGAPNEIGNTGTFHVDYSNIQGSGGSAGWTLSGASVTDYGHNIDADPMFYNALTLSILPNSPARNGGKNAYNNEPYDIYGGNVRISQDVIDMGAFEVNSVVYVATDAPSGGDGKSWATAFNNLNDGIAAAGNVSILQKDIWVKEGIYRPDRIPGSNTVTPNNRDNSFYLNRSLKIFGGFAGTETSILQRNMGQYPTILSGDLGLASIPGDNAYHVITMMAGDARLDGLIIENGNADHPTDADKQRGGGVFEYSENAGGINVVANCVLRNNRALLYGGAWYVRANKPGTANFVQSIFYGNLAHRGAVSYIQMNHPNADSYNQNYYNVTAIGNVNVSNIPNSGVFEAVEQSSSLPANIRFYNSLLSGNAPLNYSDVTNVGHITLNNTYSSSTNTGIFVNPTNIPGVDGKIMTADDGIQLNPSSPAINFGDNTFAFSGIDKDITGNPRITNNIDAGAYESTYTAPFIPDANGIIYVKLNTTGNGTSWDNPTGDLHNAIQAEGVQKVFVAIGNYKVGDNSFIMKNGVAIYGGFDPENNIKTLNDKRIMPNAASLTQGSVLDGENARPVIWNVFTSSTAINNTAILDGFAITKGAYADGAGIRNIYASPTLNNLVIAGNAATVSGAGIYNNNSNPLLTNSVINSNTIVNLNNGITVNGAGISNIASSAPVLTNVNLVGNLLVAPLGTMKGAGMYSNNSSPKIYNSIIWNNQKINNAFIAGADIENEGGATLTLKNSITQLYNSGNTTDNNKVSANPQFVGESVADYRLSQTSPAVDAGDNSYLAGGGLDLAGNPRLRGTKLDMGAYEFTLVPNNADGIVYVRETATGNGNGSSWDDATADLQEAINSGATKVFVAVGQYPVSATASFVMKNGVAIYGGFDPDNNIKTLNDNRILPSEAVAGSVLNGGNTRPVIWNVFNSSTSMDNTAILDAFTISGGKATGNGGGFHNEYASPTLTNLVIKNNYASNDGGGMYNAYSSPNITKSIFIENSAGNNGGAIVNDYSYPNITNVIIKSNHAGFLGGGITSGFDSSPVLTNVLIVQNTAVTNGGGIYNGAGKGELTNVTIANNTPNAISIRVDKIKNAIIFGGISTVNTLQNSFIQGSTNTANGNVNTAGIGMNDVFNNVSAGDYTLKPTSPVINKGNNTLYQSLDANSKDLKGDARVYNFATNGIVDLGAYESTYETPAFGPDSQGIMYVTKYGDGNQSGDSWENATSSLRRAIHSNGVQQVWVATGNYEMDGVSLIMKNGVAIYGGFNPVNNIRTLNDMRIFPGTDVNNEGSVLDGLNERPVIWNDNSTTFALDNTAKLDGFTIKNGKATLGGGIYNSKASPTLNNLLITNNVADNDGGGMYNNSSSSPVMYNVTVSNNKANYGAGIFNRLASSPVMANVTLNENKANNDGGAMYNDGSSSPAMTNVSITGNSAQRGAGMFNRANSSPVLVNVLIANNTATNYGAAICNATASPSLTNVTIANNSGSIALYINGPISLSNTIVYGVVSGNYTAQYSLVENKTDISNGNVDATGITADQIFTDPSNGDYTLKSGSIALNKGSNALFSGLDVNTKDLADNPRVYNFTSGGLIDLGAYERQGQWQIINPIANMVKTYGDAPFEPGGTASSGLTVSYQSADNSIAEAYQDVADANKWKIKIKKAGTVTITASQPGNGDYSAATNVDFTITVNKKAVTLAFTAAALSKTYDGKTIADVSATNLSFANGDIINGDDVQIQVGSGAVYDTKDAGTNKVITLPLTGLSLSGTSAANYSISNSGDLNKFDGQITQANLSIKANNAVKTYDSHPYADGNGVTYTGFVNSENESVLQGILSYTGSSQGAVMTGTYQIMPGGYTSANYAINFVPGNLIISSTTVNTLSFQAQTTGSTLNKVYGDAAINASAVASSGLTVSYQSTNPLVATVDGNGQVTLVGVGTADIQALQAGDANHGAATTIGITMVVSRKALSIKANDLVKTYDGMAYTGGNGVTYSGFVNGEDETALQGTLSYTGTSQGAKNIGSYILGLSGYSSANYEITYQQGNLTINAKAINVIADAKSKAFGAGDPALTYTANPALITGDNFSGSLTRATGESAGVYAISQGNLSAGSNYTINYTPANFTIGTNVVTVVVESKTKVYGDADPAFTYNVTGLAPGDVLTGSLGRVAGENAGNYSITQGNLSAGSNYTLSFTGANLTITPKAINVIADAKSKSFGDADPLLTYTSSPALVAGDGFTGSLTRATGESAGIYAISQGNLSAGSNYTINYTPANFTIGTNVVTVVAEAKTKVYGDVDPAFTYTVTGLAPGDVLTGSLNRAAGENAGNYSITQGNLSAGSNYTLNFTGSNLTITPKAINVIADAKSKAFGDADPALTYTASPALITGDNFTGSLTREAGESAGIYAISQGNLTAGSNYTINYTSANFTIGSNIVTVTAVAKSKVYGDVDPEFTYNVTGLAPGDVLTGSLDRVAGENAGSYSITQGNLSAGANYTINYTSASLTISPKPVTVKAGAKTKVYGAVEPVYTYTVSPALITGDSFSGSLTRTAGENVGTYAINQGTLTAGSNYTITYNTADLSITPKAINVVADAKSKAFGDADPALTYTVNPALVAGDSFTGSLTRAAGESAGTYAISQGNLTAGANYTINFTPANFTIGANIVTVTAVAKSKVYGDADPALTYTVTGLAPGDVLTGSLNRVAGENAGTYSITQGNLSAGANYTLSFTGANLTISPKPVTVTAGAKTKVYGAVDPTLSYTVNPALITGDSFNGSLTRTTGENVGTYAINQGTLTPGANYTITYNTADLTITSKAINVIADAKSKAFGAGDPALTYTASPALVASDSFTGSLTRAAGESAGTYAISQGNLTAGTNYTISFTPANFTIGTNIVTVTAVAKSKVYGDTDPAFTYTVTGLAPGDVLTGSLDRVSGENVGSYGIIQGTLSVGANYTLSFTGANLAISPKPITVTAATKTKTYGAVEPVYTYTISPALVTGDSFTGSLTRTAGENVGTYAINQGTLTAGSNYTITYNIADLTITSKTINVIADAKNKAFGGGDPALTYTVNPALVAGDSFTGSLTRAVGESAGTYPISQGNLTAGTNYTISFTPANFTIGANIVTVIAQSKSKVYGNADPAFTYTVTGLAPGDVLTGSLDRVAGENAGSYSITQGNLSAGASYTINYTSANLTISPKPVTITAAVKTKVYGVGDPALTYTISPALITGDSFTGSLTRTAGENVGTYTINQGTLTAGTNYALAYNTADLTISPKAINVIANAKSKAFGGGDPALTYTVNPALVAGDSFNGGLTRAVGENIGTYAINQGTLSAGPNYTLSFTPANFTIGANIVTVTAVAKSKVYGDADPAFTYTVAGLAPGDVLTGSLKRVAGENAGTYLIGLGDLSAGPNYQISYISSNFVIGKAVLTISAKPAEVCVGNKLPVFSLSYVGFKNGDTENSLTTKPVVSANATSTSPAGSYVLSPTGGVSSNYEFNYVSSQLLVNSLPQVTLTSDMGLRTSVSKGEFVKLTVSGGASYEWHDENGIIMGQQSAQLQVRPKVTTTYTVKVSNASGCSQEKSITIAVIEDYNLEAGTVITPNSDGINDKFVIKNIDYYPNNTLKIFDKAGRVLYTKKAYNNDWDGTVNGSPLYEGTYYYILDLGQGAKKFKGYINIIRD